MDPNNGGQIVASIRGVTVRDEVLSSPAAPRITAAVSTLAGLEVDGDETMREYTTTPTGITGITVGYTAPHPTENPAPSGGLGRSYLSWRAAAGKVDLAHDALWTLGWRGNRGHCIDRNAAGSWDRVAGGTRTYTSCSPAVFTEAAYDDDGILRAPSFQHALTGAASAGEFRLVIHGYSGTYFTPATALAVFGQAS